MKPSALLLILALTLGIYAHALRGTSDTPLTGVSINTAKRARYPLCPAWGGGRGGRRHNLAVYVVKGSLLALDSDEKHYSMDLGDEVVNEYKLELLCEDGEVEALVAALMAAARTGQAFAGWITVIDVVSAMPIH